MHLNWQPSASIETLRARARILQQIRAFFHAREVLEVETPLMCHTSVTDPVIQSIPAIFQAHPHSAEQRYYLQTSPEYAMKRLLAAGCGSIFQISKAFRQGEIGRLHNPEFTMLEWYRVGFDYHQLMDEVDALLQTVLGSRGQAAGRPYESAARPHESAARPHESAARPHESAARPHESAEQLHENARRLHESNTKESITPQLKCNEVIPRLDRNEVIPRLDRGIHGTTSQRITYQALFKTHLGIDPLDTSIAELATCARQHKINIASELTDLDAWLNLLMTHCIEPTLGQEQPVFVYDFPASQAALAKLSPADPRVAARFEVYMHGMELANGFDELQDAKEQRRRFEANLAERQRQGLPGLPIDENFLAALQNGLPPCAGVALGVDRLIMLALGCKHIQDSISFDFARS